MSNPAMPALNHLKSESMLINKHLLGIGLILVTFAAFPGQQLQLTTTIPACKLGASRPLPPAYYATAVHERAFKWVNGARKSDAFVGGPGWPRVDGSDLDNYFSFYRVDLNNDGICDWFLDSDASISTGGDRNSINTLYIGQGLRWKRIGVLPRADGIDIVRGGVSYEEDLKFLFGEDISILHDNRANVNYFITAFYDRHEEQRQFPGYRIFVWDESLQSLRLLNKWETGSAGYQVYGYFKQHGASNVGNEDGQNLVKFDSQIENQEIERACEAVMSAKSGESISSPLPSALLAGCGR